MRHVLFVLATAVAATIGGLAPMSASGDDIYLYSAEPGPANPRVPVVAPQKGGSRGRCFPLRLIRFSYPLKPYIRFPAGGQLSAAVRYGKHPTGTNPFELSDGTHSLRLTILDLGKNNQTQLIYLEGKKELAAVSLDSFTNDWTPVRLAWKGTTATLYREEKKVAEIELKVPFAPTKLLLYYAWNVDEVRVSGDGQLSLDWESGYAARVRPTPRAEPLLIPRLFGFDSYVISLDLAKRDCPMLQLINTGQEKRSATIRFELHSEVTGQDHTWDQQATVPPRSDTMLPIQFPFEMKTDVYHLAISSEQTDPPLKARKHFMYVKLRDEPAGPHKFGFHDGDRGIGFWPDALPIHLAHRYLTWFYTQGPVWVRWWNGNWGIDPDLPPEQWYWRPVINADFYAGRTVYVCISGVPALPWMRGKEYGKEFPRRKLCSDYVGGVPNYKLYRRFLRAVANRYKGKIAFYEVENEANGTHGSQCLKPEDYLETCKAVYEETKAVDPNVRVFGICGTGSFIGWMRKVFELGAHRYMDGVSWHTYVTPHIPDEVDLPGKLARARQIMGATGKTMPAINSETGTKIALRETVDRPVSDARLQELIKEGRAGGDSWPGHAMSERRGGASFVENAIVNFLAGAEYFTFFGWKSNWASTEWKDCISWALISASNKDAQRTPALHTLAVGVLTAQMEPAIHTRGRTVKQYGVRGGIFPKKNGGEVAVLWSARGRRTVSVMAETARLERVTMLGLTDTLTARKGERFYTHTIELGEEPCYVHSDMPLLGFAPSPVKSAATNSTSVGKVRLTLTLENVFANRWQGKASLKKDTRWRIEPAERQFDLAPGKRIELLFDFEVAVGVAQGRYSQTLDVGLPDGGHYVGAVEIPVKSVFRIPRLPEGTSLAKMRDWKPPGGPLLIDRIEQVAIGKPHALASRREKDTWGGAEELSAKVKIGYNNDGLFVYTEVHDAAPRLPQGWPGVLGSSLEFYFDFRAADAGLGQPSYGPQVHQVVIRPVIQEGQKPAFWHPSESSARLTKLSFESGSLDKTTYWACIRIPWSDTGRAWKSGMPIGFDVAVNGPGPTGRKTQMVMFGTENNYVEASLFGVGILGGVKGE